ncbi:MAG: chondroitinase-B domain-containing protein [Verrucomicrobiales bacterium]|nr:chondroitinase-B domain-containing protein [Verrucomicrobiales bacterium]
MTFQQLFSLLVLLHVSSLPSMGVEYFVTKQGNDSNEGTGKATAFRTLRKGIEILQAGDVLTIGRGEYSESITRDGLGNMEVETMIRAEIPGTVVLRGDVALPSTGFEKVEGSRFLYVTDFDKEIQAVSEIDTLTVLRIQALKEELEFRPGTSYHDVEAGKLYLSTSDLRSPDTHHYTVSTIQGSGLMLTNPRRVTVDGIAATGYQNSVPTPHLPGKGQVWGILLSGARSCVVRNCVVYLNRSGIGIDSGEGLSKDGVENGWNVIEKCVGYGNNTINLIGYASNHDEIRDCIAYRAHSYGIRLYGAGIRGPALVKNCLSWGNGVDIMIKGGEADKYAFSENSITLGNLHSANLKHSIVGTHNQYNRSPGEDTIYGLFSPFGNQEVKERNRDECFADPKNFDFRLQSSAKYRAAAPDVTDSGPFPYQANIFYVAETGDDINDGLSTKQPWKTLAHAMGQLRSGDTLYLEGGTYLAADELKIANPGEQVTSIRSRGTKPVVLKGDIDISGSRGLEWERIHFTGALSLDKSQGILFNNCRFTNQGTPLAASAVEDLKITHCEFTGFEKAALLLKETSRVWLSGNRFDNRMAPAIQLDNTKAIFYSDYNSYSGAGQVWQVAGDTHPLQTIQKEQDIYSRVGTNEYIPGPLGTPTGFYLPNKPVVMRATSPELHSVSGTTADIEWWASVPAITEVAWGETADTPNRSLLNKGASSVIDGFNTFSLEGLKPGTKYFVRLISSRPSDGEVAQYTPGITFHDSPLIFETPAEATTARTLYVSPDGDDSLNGLTRERAWKTVSHAAREARVGDTVIIGGGTYREIVRVRSSGSEKRPITFQAAPGEKVIFDGNERLLDLGISVVGKQHIHFDGLYFRNYTGNGWRSVMDLRFSSDILVTRCFFNGYGKIGVGTQLRAQDCENVTVRNCVFCRGFQGIVVQLESTMRLENNVFMNNLTTNIGCCGGPSESFVVRNNLFVDSIPSKVGVCLFELGGLERHLFAGNAFYLRIPDAERKPFLFYAGGPGRTSIAEYQKKLGHQNLVVDDPHFAISEGQQPRDWRGNKITFLGDWIPRIDLDFPDLFTLHPELTEQKIGLREEAFDDFHFHQPDGQSR